MVHKPKHLGEHWSHILGSEWKIQRHWLLNCKFWGSKSWEWWKRRVFLNMHSLLTSDYYSLSKVYDRLWTDSKEKLKWIKLFKCGETEIRASFTKSTTTTKTKFFKELFLIKTAAKWAGALLIACKDIVLCFPSFTKMVPNHVMLLYRTLGKLEVFQFRTPLSDRHLLYFAFQVIKKKNVEF